MKIPIEWIPSSKPKIIALSGIAGSGKNLFIDLAKEILPIPVCELSLGYILKSELREFIAEKFGFDIVNCSRPQKDKVRNLLTNYADIRRRETRGKYFWLKLNKEIQELGEVNYPGLCVISDIRFNEYPESDEAFWIKNIIGAKLIHISRYEIVNGERVFRQPPNEFERYNDPLMKELVDFKLEWETKEDKNELIPLVKEIINKIGLETL